MTSSEMEDRLARSVAACWDTRGVIYAMKGFGRGRVPVWVMKDTAARMQ